MGEKSNGERTTLMSIAKEVAAFHGIGGGDLIGRDKAYHIAWARQHFYWEAMARTTASTPQIGRWCGDRHHTTILWGAKRHAARHGLPPPREGKA